MSLSITFFSNFFNAHQLPVALELAADSEVAYTFVAMQEVNGLEGRSCLNDDYSFVIRQYLGRDEAARAMGHALDDDIVVFGDMAGDESYVRARAKSGKPFFRYAERLLKRGDWWAYVPPKRYRTYDRFTRYNKHPMYVLCASGYTARDLDKFGFAVERCLKWGYFPLVGSNDVSARADHLQGNVAMCSAQRLIPWKRVDLQVRMAAELKKRGIPFTLAIAGDGREVTSLKKLARKLDVTDCVSFVGTLTAEETAALMKRSDIFLATSNRKEGWGATINESMAAGCAVVASNQIGAAPFLINAGADGAVFRSGDLENLADVVSGLLSDRRKLRTIANAGLEKIRSIWSAESAAARLVEASKCLLEKGRIEPFGEGPLSAAGVIGKDWYLR